MVDAKTENIIGQFVAALKQHGISVKKVVLYGSTASGMVHEHSDLDVAVVSEQFGTDRFEEGKRLSQIAWRVDPRLHPVPVSVESYENNAWVPLIHEIRSRGVEIPQTQARQ